MTFATRSCVSAYIALGANLGDTTKTLTWAIQEISFMGGCGLIAQSSFYRTAPLDSTGPDYVNAVIEIQTTLIAPVLLYQLQILELRAGRVRPYINAPRTLDLDILTYGDASMDSPALVIPHPRMTTRAFVLVPLAEIAPHAVTKRQLQAVSEQFIERE